MTSEQEQALFRALKNIVEQGLLDYRPFTSRESTVAEHIWNAGWRPAVTATPVRVPCPLCGPGYFYGDEGCRHTRPVNDGASESLLRDKLEAAFHYHLEGTDPHLQSTPTMLASVAMQAIYEA